MRFRRTKHDRVLVVGIFQSPKTGRAVLKNLHRTQFRRAAAIHASARGRPRIEENGISAIGGSAAAAAFGLALGAFIFWQREMLADYRLGGLALFFVAFGLAGALTGWILVRLLQEHVAAASLARCVSTILPGETVVLDEVRATETSRLLAIMRDVEAEAPVTFAFHSPPHFRFKSSARPLGHELPSGQRLAENAARLAHEIPVSREAKARGRLGAGVHRKISGRFSGDRAAGHRRTLGPAADVAIAVARMPARARDPSRATAKPERGGRLLGESAHHRRPPQFATVAQDDGSIGGTVSRADAAFCERTGGASLRRRGGAPAGERLAGTLAAFAAARGYAAGTSAPGRTADRAHQCDQ